jgi:hypothetical protein
MSYNVANFVKEIHCVSFFACAVTVLLGMLSRLAAGLVKGEEVIVACRRWQVQPLAYMLMYSTQIALMLVWCYLRH